MLGLYALGKLDLYGAVFDVNYFYQNRDEYLGHMLFEVFREKRNHQGYYNEIYQCLIQRDIKIPIAAKKYVIKLLYSAMKQKVKGTMRSLA